MHIFSDVHHTLHSHLSQKTNENGGNIKTQGVFLIPWKVYELNMNLTANCGANGKNR